MIGFVKVKAALSFFFHPWPQQLKAKRWLPGNCDACEIFWLPNWNSVEETTCSKVEVVESQIPRSSSAPSLPNTEVLRWRVTMTATYIHQIETPNVSKLFQHYYSYIGEKNPTWLHLMDHKCKYCKHTLALNDPVTFRRQTEAIFTKYNSLTSIIVKLIRLRIWGPVLH